MRVFVSGLLLAIVISSFCLLYGDQAPSFVLPGIDGQSVDVGKEIGTRTVVLNFWASWCASCVEEIPELQAFQKISGAEKAAFIGVNAGENERKAKKFAEKYGYPYLIVLDKDKSIAKKYGVLGLPTTIIISKERTIVFRGSRPPKDFTFK